MKKENQQTILVLHTNLMSFIKGKLVPEKLEELKEVLKGREKLTPHDSSKCDTFEKVWENLCSQKHIEYGTYDILKEVFTQIGKQDLSDEIKKVEKKIQTIRSTLIEPKPDLAHCRIDVPLTEDSPIVRKNRNFNEHPLREVTQMEAMKAEAALEHIATVVASRNREFINGVKSICSSTRGIFDKIVLLMSKYEQRSSYCIKTLEHMNLYLDQNQSKHAFMSLAAVGKYAEQNCEETSKLIEDIEEKIDTATEFADKVGGHETKTQEEFKELMKEVKNFEMELSFHERNLTDIKAAIVETIRLENVSNDEYAKVHKSTQAAATNVGLAGVTSAAVGAVGMGVVAFEGAAVSRSADNVIAAVRTVAVEGAAAASTAIRTVFIEGVEIYRAVGVALSVGKVAAIAAPILAIITLEGYKMLKDSERAAQALKEEGQRIRQKLQKHRDEQKKSAQEIDERLNRQEELRHMVKSTMNLRCCLRVAQRYMNEIKFGLEKWQKGWENMKITSQCEVIQDSHTRMMEHAEEDHSKAFILDGFKQQVDDFRARLVAWDSLAMQGKKALEESAKMLEDTRHITIEEAKARLEAAENEELFSCSALMRIVRTRKH